MSLLFVMLKGNLVQWKWWGYVDLDLIILLAAYLLVFCSDAGAMIYVFGMGLFIDVSSAGPLGFFTLIYTTVFLGLKLGSLFFDLFSARGQVTLIGLAVLLKALLFFLMLYIFSFEISPASSNILPFASSALCTGLLAPPAFALMKAFTRQGGQSAARH